MSDLIDRQAAIDMRFSHGRMGDNGVLYVPFWEVKENLSHLPSAQPEPITVNIDHELTQEEYEKLRKDMANAPIILLPAAQPEPKWIPCSERLPEDERRSYWVCTDNGYQHECRWTNVNPFWTNLTTDWHWNIFDIPQYSKVIAWMQLPESWKGEKHEAN